MAVGGESEDRRRVVRVFSDAHREPFRLGRVGDVPLPVAPTFGQVAVFVLVCAAVWVGMSVVGAGGVVARVLGLVVVPGVLAWLWAEIRVDGLRPWAGLLGRGLLFRSVAAGRGVRRTRRTRVRSRARGRGKR